MIKRLSLIRNIGQFDSVSEGAQLELDRLALIYAENGRGKTTISGILRSLQSGSNAPIIERTRLGSTRPPHVVIEMESAPTPTIFQNDAWSRVVPEIIIYDDVFVDENVYSGLNVEANHRQNLNEVILGSQGVALNRQLQQHVQRIETHNHDLRARADAIPAGERGALSVDDFCALPDQVDVEEALNESIRALAAVTEAEAVRRAVLLEEIAMPALDLASIRATSERSLEAIDSAAVARVEEQVRRLGAGSGTWLADGVTKMHDDHDGRPCPFCAQSTTDVELVDSYRAYFSSEYAQLKSDITAAQTTIEAVHGRAAIDRVANAITTLLERRQYWIRFTDLPEIDFDAPAAIAEWDNVANQANQLLDSKRHAPLEQMQTPERLEMAVARLEEVRTRVAALNGTIVEMNRSIAIVKERAAAGNAAAIEADIRRLRMIRARHSEPIAIACQEYQNEKRAKAQTELLRDQARTALDVYRTATFPAYEISINLYLQRLNADFRVDSVTSTATRGGASCTYNVIINHSPVAVGNNSRSALSIVRSAQGSTLQSWDVTADTITEHDRRHAAMRTYIATNAGNARSVAESLRPILEIFLRAAYPDAFGPGALLGPFIDRVRPLSGTPTEVLSMVNVSELQDLKEYANRFHHDTNAAFQSELINEGELVAFARRVHAFTRRP
jgi:wobble nucleotide-excising tRNase